MLSDGKGLWQETGKRQVGNAALPGRAHLPGTRLHQPIRKGLSSSKKKGDLSHQIF